MLKQQIFVQQKLQNYKETWKLDAVCHQTKQTEPTKYIEIYWNIQVLVFLFLKEQFSSKFQGKTGVRYEKRSFPLFHIFFQKNLITQDVG